MINTGLKILKTSLVLLLFLSLTLISQDPPKKQEPRDTTRTVSVRPADTLYIQQMELNMKLDSLILEKKKR